MFVILILLQQISDYLISREPQLVFSIVGRVEYSLKTKKFIVIH